MLTRQRDLIKWLFGVMTTVVVILGMAWLFEAQTPGTQANKQKEAILRGETPTRVPASVKGEQGKGSGNLAIAIRPVGTSPEGVLTLNAEIQALADLDGLKYQWVLPENVSVTTGSNEGSIGNLANGEVKEVETTFAFPPGENKQIHLQVYTMNGEEKMGEVAQYNTTRQTEIDRTVASKREVLELDAAEGLQKPKLMH